MIFNSTGAVVYGGVISSSGTVEQSGAGLLTLIAANTYTGTTTIDSGTTLQIGDAVAGAVVSNTITDNGTLVFNRSAAYTQASTIVGTGAVQTIAVGPLTLSGPDTYSGVTTIAAGEQLVLTNATFGTGNITDNGTLSFAATGLTVAGSISGTGVVVLTSGTTTLTGANSYSGVTTLTTGTLTIAGTGTLGTNNSVVLTRCHQHS